MSTLAVLEPHHGGRARGVQPAGEDPGAGGLDLLVQRVDVPHDRIQNLRRGRISLSGVITLSRYCFIRVPPWYCAGTVPASHHLYEREPRKSTWKSPEIF